MFTVTGNRCSETESCPVNPNNDLNYHCNATHCIRESQVCDGIPDCSQGQDEAVFVCGKIMKNMFSSK